MQCAAGFYNITSLNIVLVSSHNHALHWIFLAQNHKIMMKLGGGTQRVTCTHLVQFDKVEAKTGRYQSLLIPEMPFLCFYTPTSRL